MNELKTEGECLFVEGWKCKVKAKKFPDVCKICMMAREVYALELRLSR